MTPITWAAFLIAGSAGAVLRYVVDAVIGYRTEGAFPWGTFAINVSGSLFLGWFTTVLDERLVLSATSWIRADDLRLLVAVGFTGAYTTFSTFEYETHRLLGDGDGLAGASYVALSVFIGLVAVRCGVRLAGSS
jgi:CrcB protein